MSKFFDKIEIYGSGNTHTSNGLSMYNSAGTNTFRVNDKGQLFINSTSNAGAGLADVQLTIESTTGDSAVFLNSIGSGGHNTPAIYLGNAGNAYSSILGVNTNLWLKSTGGFEVRNQTTNYRGLYRDNSQNWLITYDSTGSQEPSARLHINGQTTGSSSFALIVNNSASTGNFLTVRDDGKVGIGTNSPGATLDINGSLATQSVTFASAVDLNDLGLSGTSYLRINETGAGINVTGFSGGTDGMRLTVTILSGTVTFKNQNTGSTASNRIITSIGGGGDFPLLADDTTEFIYDGVSQRWRHVNQ